MIDAEYLAEVQANIEENVSSVNYEIVQAIAKRLIISIEKFNEPKLITSSLKNILQLEASGLLYEDIERIIEQSMPQFTKEVRKAFNDAIERIEIFEDVEQVERKMVPLDEPTLEEKQIVEEELKPKSERFSKEMKIKVDSAYRRTNGELKNLTRTTASAGQQRFVQILDEAYQKAQQGMSTNKVILDAIKEASFIGGEVVYPSGHRDKIEVAIARAVRTGINQANADIVLTRCGELGISYVKVSEHIGARVTKQNDYTNHSWWQGQAYHLDWSNPKLKGYLGDHEPVDAKNEYNLPDFMEYCNYGHPLGCIGINCRHSISLFFPNLQEKPKSRVDNAENEKKYNAEQKARAMERAIRKTKREIEALKQYDTDEARELLAQAREKLRQQSKAYADFCRENKLREREWSKTIPTTKE